METLACDGFQASASALATVLATRIGCTRASLGFSSRRRIRIRAFSHSIGYAEKQDLLRKIRFAMEEAADQDCTIVYPPVQGDGTATYAHRELSESSHGHTICTVPLIHDRTVIGALTVERHGDQEFDPETVALCEQIAAFTAPILELKRRDDRWLIAKVGSAIRDSCARLIGPHYLMGKTVTAAAAAATAFFAITQGTWQVAGEAELEGAVERVIAAPLTGFIASAATRPGDRVMKGDLLAELDSEDLRLDREKMNGQRQQFLSEYRDALAKGQRSQVGILKAKLDRAQAQVELLSAQIARTRITSPFDGVIVSGDLSRSLGAPVEQGQVLLKVAPLDQYRVTVKVDERDIAAVATGQRGTLTLSGLPEKRLPIVVDKITPVSTAENGRNFFNVETSLGEETSLLRPGMQGIAKIDVGRRPLLWVWTHRMVSWLRLTAWAWCP